MHPHRSPNVADAAGAEAEVGDLAAARREVEGVVLAAGFLEVVLAAVAIVQVRAGASGAWGRRDPMVAAAGRARGAQEWVASTVVLGSGPVRARVVRA